MVLSDRRIIEERNNNNIVIEPFFQRQLSTSSYDVKLGEFFFREHHTDDPLFNIYDEVHTANVWGTKAEKARTAEEVLGGPRKGIRASDQVILIEPGETILCHTQEFIGGVAGITTMMKSRSSIGRDFLEMCKCAGWGDVGYFNRWTMEITNINRTKTIPLVVGRRVAQIVFFETGPTLTQSYSADGKYQSGADLKKLMEDWHPGLMLPRLYKDIEAQVVR